MERQTCSCHDGGGGAYVFSDVAHRRPAHHAHAPRRPAARAAPGSALSQHLSTQHTAMTMLMSPLTLAMEGYGTYRFPSGTVYTGEFLDGEFHGDGEGRMGRASHLGQLVRGHLLQGDAVDLDIVQS